jgi:NO-binding membrane sensor protein with MHYT domain
MHYIGNRAITLYGGEPGLQLSYGAGFTIVSFFLPVVVLLLAYAVIGAVDTPRFWRLLVGGTFAGAAICGMHYLVRSHLPHDINKIGTTINCKLFKYV